MKRTIALLACLFALAACGNQADDNASKNAQAANGSDNGASGDSGNSDGQKENDKAADKSGDKAGFDSDKQKRSYALGMDIGNSLKELPVQVDMDSLSQGVRDVISGGDTKLTQQELDGVMQGFVKDMQSAQKKKAQAAAQTNQQKGEKFLSDNKKKDGVKSTDSGLQYKVLNKGDGPSPDANDSVTVHYVGKLIDGTVFDSSRKRGEPVTFPVNAVIPGWTEALQLMKQGAKYELYIPAKLAYGERGAGAQIGPNETLIFEVELLKVNKKASSGGDDAGASSDTPDAQSGQADSQSGQAQSSDESSGQSSQGNSGDDQMSQGQSGQSSQSQMDQSKSNGSGQGQMSEKQSGQSQKGQDQSSQDQMGQGQMSEGQSGQKNQGSSSN